MNDLKRENGNLMLKLNDEWYTLASGIELLALTILDDMAEKRKRTEIMQNCEILDSLSNALLAIKS